MTEDRAALRLAIAARETADAVVRDAAETIVRARREVDRARAAIVAAGDPDAAAVAYRADLAVRGVPFTALPPDLAASRAALRAATDSAIDAAAVLVPLEARLTAATEAATAARVTVRVAATAVAVTVANPLADKLVALLAEVAELRAVVATVPMLPTSAGATATLARLRGWPGSDDLPPIDPIPASMRWAAFVDTLTLDADARWEDVASPAPPPVAHLPIPPLAPRNLPSDAYGSSRWMRPDGALAAAAG